MLANGKKGGVSVVGLFVIMVLLVAGIDALFFSVADIRQNIKYINQIDDFFSSLSKTDDITYTLMLPVMKNASIETLREYLSKGGFCDVSSNEVVLKEGKSFKKTYYWRYFDESDNNIHALIPMLENRLVKNTAIALDNEVYKKIPPKSIFIDVFSEGASSGVDVEWGGGCDATLVYLYDKNLYVSEFYYVIEHYSFGCKFIIKGENIRNIAYRTYPYVLDRERQKAYYLSKILNIPIPSEIIQLRSYLDKLNSLPSKLTFADLYISASLPADKLNLFKETLQVLKDYDDRRKKAAYYFIIHKDEFLNEFFDSSGRLIDPEGFSQKIEKYTGVKLSSADIASLQQLYAPLKSFNEEVNGYIVDYLANDILTDMNAADTSLPAYESSVNVVVDLDEFQDAMVIDKDRIAERLDELSNDLSKLNEAQNILQQNSDLKTVINACKFKNAADALNKLEDLGEISFSKEYDAFEAYDRLKNLLPSFEIADLTESFEQQGLSEYDVNVLAEVLSTTQATTKEELRQIAESLGEGDVKNALLRISSLPNLKDELIMDFKESLISGLVPTNLACSHLGIVGSALKITQMSKEIKVLMNSFDSARLEKLRYLFPYYLKYQQMIDAYRDAYDAVNIDLETCKFLLSTVDFKDVIAFFNELDSLTLYGDEFSVCMAKSMPVKSNINILVNEGEGFYKVVSVLPSASYESKNKFKISIPNMYEIALNYSKGDVSEFSNMYVMGEEIVSNVEQYLRRYIDDKKSFTIRSIECGKCKYFPDPIKKTTSDEIKEALKTFVDSRYGRSSYKIEIEDVRVDENVIDKSHSYALTGCFCGSKTAKVCITSYEHVLSITVKLKISKNDISSGWEIKIEK